MEAPARRLPRPALPRSFRPRMSWELAAFLGLALVALGLRLWELDGRTMHYDEAIHVHYAWRLAEGEGFSHSPWMHGPLQIHLTALVFKVFSDSDFTARLIYALFGAGLVFLPFFLRSHLGRTGALVTSLLLALSPSLLYFSRFGRNDILMVFFAVALLVLMWRYLNEGRNRYLYMASAVLALSFATKETAYIMVVIFGIGLFLISITEIVPWLLGRIRLSEVGPAPAFLVLLVTLTLPQWSALASIPLGPVGLELVNEGVGDVGLPVLGDFVSFPLADLPLPVDLLIIVGIVVVPVGAVATRRIGWGWARWLLPAAVLAALAYAMVSLPHGTVPRGYLISLGVIAGALVASAIFGLMWRWKVWLVCAAIFYLIWGMLYTSVFSVFVQPHGFCPGDLGGFFGTLCSKAGGIYTGSWQGLGYWLAQQDVARAEQPSYYYFLTGSVYEFLPLIFGLIAVVYYVRKGDLFGLVLSFWAVATLVAYSLASEKMPWLLVNVAVPFILLTGKLANDLTQRVPWRRVLRSPHVLLLVLTPMVLLATVHLLHDYLADGKMDSWHSFALLGTVGAIVAACAWLVARARPRVGMTLIGLGAGVLFLAFSTFVAFRASYSYDDSPVEMLVYAQGSSDVVQMVQTLGSGVIDPGADGESVEVDYEIWYPMNWYVRHEQSDGTLAFRCFKDETEGGYVDWCNPLEQPPSTRALLLNESHANRASSQLEKYEKLGPFKNLLWFPESYKRPGANRREEGLAEELKQDITFVAGEMASREPWNDALEYFLFRSIGSNWWDSRFYAYIDQEPIS